MAPFPGRRERLLKTVRDESLDAVLVTHPVNVTYLTGFTGDSSAFVLTPDRGILVSDGRFTEQIAEECPDLETVIRPPTQPLIAAVAELLAKLGLGSVGIEGGHLTLAEFDRLRDLAKTVNWKPADGRVEELRRVKDDTEVAQIRQAVRIAEKAFAMFRAMLRPADTEKDLADNLEHYIRQAGGKCSAFPPIVAVGARAALPHAPPTARRIDEAAMVLIDWGADGGLYKSDLTRVLLTHNYSAVAGPARVVDAKLREVYEVVLRAQAAAIAAVRPGVETRDVDRAARSVIADAGYGDYFTHSVGHGIGLQIHEAPFMRPNTAELLRPGMVVTVEPGVYLPGFAGVRIEDDVLVTPDGCEVLTSVPKNLEACVQEP